MPRKRLYELCRDLGIDSNAVINHCRAEGIAIRNHMHEVTPELEADIRRWLRDSIPPDDEDRGSIDR